MPWTATLVNISVLNFSTEPHTAAMPTFKTTHSVGCLVTHEVEADTPEQAHALAVQRTFEIAMQLQEIDPRARFGPVNDHYEPVSQIGAL